MGDQNNETCEHDWRETNDKRFVEKTPPEGWARFECRKCHARVKRQLY